MDRRKKPPRPPTLYQSFKTLLLGLVWIAFHYCHHALHNLVKEIRFRTRHIVDSLLTRYPATSSYSQLSKVFQASEKLKKSLPKHVGVLVFGKDSLTPVDLLWSNLKRILLGIKIEDIQTHPKRSSPKEDHVDLVALAKVVCCAWIADIPIVSFFDHNGYIKTHYKEFLHHVQIEMDQHLWIVGKRTNSLPILKLHNVPGIQGKKQKTSELGNNNGFENGSTHDELSTPELLNIAFFCFEDGKPGLVQTCKEVYRDLSHAKERISNKLNEVDEGVVHKKINTAVGRSFTSPNGENGDPDIMIVLGRIGSTVGFLPWEIRLTEMYWLPSLKLFDGTEFLKCILKYAKCEKRFGA